MPQIANPMLDGHTGQCICYRGEDWHVLYAEAVRQIEQSLAHVGRSWCRAAMLDLGAWCTAGALVGIGLAVAVAQLGWPAAAVVVLAGSLAVAPLAWVCGSGWVCRRYGWTDAGRQTRLAERLAPELGTAPSSAVELAHRLLGNDPSFSHDLARAHVERTADALAQADLAPRLRTLRASPRKAALVALGGTMAWAVGATVLAPQGRTRLARMVLEPEQARLSEVPLAGDIRLTYHFPAYTGLQPRVVEGGDGSIRAVAGTEVELSAHADLGVSRGVLRIRDAGAQQARDVPLKVSEGRRLGGRLSILRDGQYHFVLVDEDGDLVEDRKQHVIRALPDAYPEVTMDEPAEDLDLRENDSVHIQWRAKDDFGVAEVFLVVQGKGDGEPRRLLLAGAQETDRRRHGRYKWSLADSGVEPGSGAVFYVEVVDNDAIAGPKRAASQSRRLQLFSAAKHHEKVLERQRELLDAMVDWLGADLLAPLGKTAELQPGPAGLPLEPHLQVLGQIGKVEAELGRVVTELRGDELTKPEVVVAFENILSHVRQARAERDANLSRLAAARPPGPVARVAASAQHRQIARLERDIIYLDDLLAILRIDALKETAGELLAAQRKLQELLQSYRETQDPELRAMLENSIRDLRQRMMELLAKMASIKQGLPGEYRNMEASSMLRLDDQLNRLEKLLAEGDLDAAARELEQLANMVENMVESIEKAEEEYGGERYAEVRKQLAEFAEAFRQLEGEQKALAERTADLLKSYRDKAIDRAGRDLDRFVKKARAHALEALKQLDKLGAEPMVARASGRDLERTRQHLLDLDTLLEHRDFAEARNSVAGAVAEGEALSKRIRSRARRVGLRGAPGLTEAAGHSDRALRHARAVRDMLDRLFPEPSEVLSPRQMAEMKRVDERQQRLRKRAGELGSQMDRLSEKLPLFGGDPRESLRSAGQEMEGASADLQGGELPGAAGHERRAVDHLGRLRQSLEQASQGGQGGLPLPLGRASRSRGGSGSGQLDTRDEVEIPRADPNRAAPKFRQELLEAAKQKPPSRYEDAVRWYYDQLLR